MVKNSLKNKLIDIKEKLTKEYCVIYSDGTTKKIALQWLDCLDSDKYLDCKYLFDNLEMSIRYFSYNNTKFDTLSSEVVLGLIYEIDDIENGKPKKNAKPLDQVAAFKFNDIYAYKNAEKVNIFDTKTNFSCGTTFVKYDKYMEEIKNNGLKFCGPKDYKELIDNFETGEKFKCYLLANLDKEDVKQKIK